MIHQRGRPFLKNHKVPKKWREKLSRIHKGNKYCLGKKLSEKTKQKISKALKNNKNRIGQKNSEETKKKIGLKSLGRNLGNKHTNWKGEFVSYGALHSWVRRMLKSPDTCEFCNISGLKGKQIHWANKSHEYKRNLTDWLRLCVKCHKQYDTKMY